MKVFEPIKNGALPEIKCILFGLGGSGKSTLAYSANIVPELSPVIGINYGGNPDKIMRGDKPPFVIDCDAVEDIDSIYQYLVTGQKDEKFRAKFGLPKDLIFKTLIFDTVSDWQRMRIEQLVGPDKEDIISQAKAPEATKHGAGIQSSTLRMARKLMVDLPLNIILTFQQQTVVDFTTGNTFTRPFLYGNSRDYVTGWAKLVGRMERGKDGVHIVHWEEATLNSVTKNQLADTLGRGMAGPTMAAVVDKLKQYYK